MTSRKEPVDLLLFSFPFFFYSRSIQFTFDTDKTSTTTCASCTLKLELSATFVDVTDLWHTYCIENSVSLTTFFQLFISIFFLSFLVLVLIFFISCGAYCRKREHPHGIAPMHWDALSAWNTRSTWYMCWWHHL